MERSNQETCRRRWAMLAGLAALTVAGCGSGGSSGDIGGDPGPTLFTMTNAAAGNQVVAFGRTAEGLLTAATRHDTGGLGTGRGLENQGAVALSGDHALLLAVNPGSDDVSVFRVSQRGLELTDRAPAGGRSCRATRACSRVRSRGWSSTSTE